jgi:hypothetical protein
MTRAWLALVPERPPDADLVAPAGDAGFLAAWRRRSKPVREALRVDERLLDAGGAPAAISLVLAPPARRPRFDDVAVQHARRMVLAGPPPDGVSTLMADDSHFAGSITVRRGPDAARLLCDDPFARVHPARLLTVGPGLLGRAPAPPGPVIERHGSAQPWPWPLFDAAPRSDTIRP